MASALQLHTTTPRLAAGPSPRQNLSAPTKKNSPTAATGSGRVRGRRAALPVLVVRRVEHVLALQLRVQPGADEERAAHLAVERVRLLGRRRQPVFEHHGDDVVDPLRGRLGAEFKVVRGGEGLAEDHHRVHVGAHHRLETRREMRASSDWLDRSMLKII